MRVLDADPARPTPAWRSRIGVQLQTAALPPKIKVREAMDLFASMYSDPADTDELLEELGIAGKRDAYVEKLSGGQKQRFAIASTLVNNPRVLFLDEPTTGLDPQARRNLWELIQQIRDDGITIVLTTHYMDEAELLCDRLAIMDGGKIITIDSPYHLIEQLLARGFKKEQHVEQANLEDVFIDLTGKAITGLTMKRILDRNPRPVQAFQRRFPARPRCRCSSPSSSR